MNLLPTGHVEELSGDLMVLFHFQDVPVPRNTLGTVDWYLSGAISRVSVDGKFTGARGTAALFHPESKFQVGKILVLGLGPRTQVDPSVLKAAARQLRSMVDGLHVQDIRIVPPDLPQIPPQEAIDHLSSTLRWPGESPDDAPTFTFLTQTSAVPTSLT
ncbi:MAG: M17 family peptidase N-terminal domain-containing protein [Candidatus Methylomirabilales bacterium]